MKLAKKQNNAFASPPEYGAIFMSNTATKKECLRRKLFGLPSMHCHFVKHIKAGMILFLFEYKKRLLYGVFEACSDGGMNIVHNAFNSSGMHFPAQVKFKTIWVCEPLPENEFRDAIKENYFTAKKFNFGLSKAQVWRLLQLFSSRKLGEPEQQLAKGRNAKSAVHSLDRVRQVDDSSCEVNDRVNGVHVWGNSDVDSEPKSATTTDDLVLEFDKVESNNSKFQMHGWGRNAYPLHTELLPAIPTKYSKYHFGEVRRLPGDEFHVNDGFQIECHKDSDFEPAIGSEYPSLLQSKLRSDVSTKPLFVPTPLASEKTKPPSPIHHQMELELLANLSSKASYRDAVVMSPHSYDSVAPGLNYQCPSSNNVNVHSIGGCLPPYGYSENVISSSRKQPFSSYSEPKGIDKFLNKNSTYRDHTCFSVLNPIDNSHHGTIIGLSQASYSENLDAKSLKDQTYTGLSSLKFSAAADMPSVRTTINPRENKFSYYPLSSHKYSSMDDYGYQVEPEDHLEHEATWRKKGEALMDNTTSTYEDSFTLQGCVSSVDPHTVQNYEHNCDIEPYQSSDTLYSVPPKNRISVFSRLAFAPDAHLSGHNAEIHYEVSNSSKSVHGIMEMLDKNHNQWVKLKKSKPGNKQDDVENLRNKRKVTSSCKAEKDCLRVSAKDKQSLPAGADVINVDCSLAGAEDMEGVFSMEKVTQLGEAMPFFNFKRRSEMRKLHHDGGTTYCNVTSEIEGVSVGQQKKRKLVRPNFSKNVSSVHEGVENYTLILQESAQEIPIMKDKTGGCEASIVNQKDEKEISFHSGKEPHLISRPYHGDWDFNSERRDTRVGSCISSNRIGDEVGKASAKNKIDIRHAAAPSICEDKNPDGGLTGNGPFLDHHKTCHFFGQETLPRLPEEKVATGTEFSGDECEMNNKVELLPTSQSVNETCPNSSEHHATTKTMKGSSNQLSELQREGKEHTALYVDTCKENVPQTSPRSSTKPSEESNGKPVCIS
ncbi:hypothetical protein L484_018484 [Morus notabilis]|uniref:DCD domain-containing protein n=2 Tax=Morus notabilis TaxID=981085 RepID=W9SBK6_9ROSA|nr:hypothetical protein L484_018484 [Morus notabilis]